MLASLDIYVSPSHTESFGLATLEAMAAGTFVIATQTEGSRELLRDEELLVPVEDPVAAFDADLGDDRGPCSVRNDRRRS